MKIVRKIFYFTIAVMFLCIASFHKELGTLYSVNKPMKCKEKESRLICFDRINISNKNLSPLSLLVIHSKRSLILFKEKQNGNLGKTYKENNLNTAKYLNRHLKEMNNILISNSYSSYLDSTISNKLIVLNNTRIQNIEKNLHNHIKPN